MSGDDLRVWQDGGPNRHRGRSAGLHVDIPRSELPGLLTRTQQDLVGFLATLTTWTERASMGRRGLDVVETIDKNLTVTESLDVAVG